MGACVNVRLVYQLSMVYQAQKTKLFHRLKLDVVITNNVTDAHHAVHHSVPFWRAELL